MYQLTPQRLVAQSNSSLDLLDPTEQVHHNTQRHTVSLSRQKSQSMRWYVVAYGTLLCGFEYL